MRLNIRYDAVILEERNVCSGIADKDLATLACTSEELFFASTRRLRYKVFGARILVDVEKIDCQ